MNAMPHGKRNARNRTVFEHLLLMAVQYTSDKIKTLWSHGYLTKEENPNIKSGNIYRLSCSGDGRNLRTKKSGSAGSLEYFVRSNLLTDMSQYDDFKYKFTYLGEGLYKITLKDNDTKALTASGTVKYTEYTGKDSQKWYVEGSDSSFYLVPLSRPTFFLTAGGKSTPKLGYNAYGGNWRLYGAEVTIYNYYDNSYVKRHASSGVTPQDYISDCQDKLNNVFTDVFDIKVINGNTPTLMQSYVDKCTELDPNDLDSYCPCTNDTHCSDMPGGHHTCIENNNDDLINQHDANNKMKEIFTLSIGHKLCVVRNNSHGSSVAGLSYTFQGKSCCTIMVNDADTAKREINSLKVVLHEQAHLLGAGGLADTKHGQCVMSYDSDWEKTANAIKDSNKYDTIFCESCKQAIKDYIDRNL